MFNSAPISCNKSLTVNLRSAIIEIPGLSSRRVKNPETRVSSTTDIEPTYNGEMYDMHSFGVHAIKNFAVL